MNVLSSHPSTLLITVRVPALGDRVKIAAKLIKSQSSGARHHEVGELVPGLVEYAATQHSDLWVHACCRLWALPKTPFTLRSGHDYSEC